MTDIHKTYISAGSNLGDRAANIAFALEFLGKKGTVTKVSSYFETQPVGFAAQPWFLNIAIEFMTSLPPMDLLNLCLDIETSRGRVRTFPNAPRILDLDILLYDDVIMTEERLIIPHPRLQERMFILKPLVQIAPELLHPVLNKTMRALLESCSDQSEVRIFAEH